MASNSNVALPSHEVAAAPAEWVFPLLRPTDPEGRNPIFPNFKNEGWAEGQAFVRELLQNTIDNRRKGVGGIPLKARVVFRTMTSPHGLDTAYIQQLLLPLEPHLVASGLAPSLRDYAVPTALVVEEFQTTGFGGDYSDSRSKGDFAAFFHGEAHDTKTGGKNGRAGQGKATYNMISGAGALLVLTDREDDQKRLLMGKALLPRTHEVLGKHYAYRAFFSAYQGEQPVPLLSDDAIDAFVAAFGLQRATGEFGSSFVIPFADPRIDTSLIVRVVIEDFFYSVIRERLEVIVDGVEISAATVLGLVDENPPQTTGSSMHEPLSKSFLSFVAECAKHPAGALTEALGKWDGSGAVSEDLFDAAALDSMKAAFAAGDVVHIRLPLELSPRGQAKQNTHVDVFLRSSEAIEKTEEAFIRRDLYIAKEKKLKGSFGKAHCLVIADDEPLSEFLANAEVASHLNWNAQEERVVERYSNVGNTLRAVRQSGKRLLELLQGGDTDVAEDLLIDILSVPLDESATKKSKKAGGSGKKIVIKKKPGVEIKSGPKYHQIVDGEGVRLQKGGDAIPASELPVQGRLDIAYHNVAFRGDPFGHYHPFDFDLADASSHPLKSAGVNVLKADENRIDFEITDPDFFLEVTGFDPNKPVRARAVLQI